MSFYNDKSHHPSRHPAHNMPPTDPSGDNRTIDPNQRQLADHHLNNKQSMIPKAPIQSNPPRNSLFSHRSNQQAAINPHSDRGYQQALCNHPASGYDHDQNNQKEDQLHAGFDQTASVFTAPLETGYDQSVPPFSKQPRFHDTSMGSSGNAFQKPEPLPPSTLPHNPSSHLTASIDAEPPRRKSSDPRHADHQPQSQHQRNNPSKDPSAGSTATSHLATPFSHQFLTTSSLAAQREYQYRKKLKALSIHSWYHNDNPTIRQTVFAKSRIAFPVLTSGEPDPNVIIQQQQQQQQSGSQRMSHPLFNLSPDRQRSILFDATPRIISNDITHNTWSKSIQCLLNQSCDCVYTFICTLCYYFKILQVIAKNNQKTIVIVSEGKEMRLDSPQAKNLLFTACNILSMKFHDDAYLTNKYFSKLYKMSILALNEIEILTYRILCWNLTLSDAVIGQVAHSLAECIDPERKQ